MKILTSRKGVEFVSNYPFWIFFVVAVGLSAIAVAYMGNYFTAQAAEIPKDLEYTFIMSRFYNSENCFAYKDELGNVYQKLIDLTKFKKENMILCFPETDVRYSFYLSLEILDKNIKAEPVKTYNWVEGPIIAEVGEDVSVLYDESRYPAKLRIKVKNA